MDDEELMLCAEMGKDARAFARKFMALRNDAERYRWLRDLLAVEDIHEALMNRMGVDEAESLKCDAAVDECMAHDARRFRAA